MKIEDKEKIPYDMRELGLAALSHANRMDTANKWDELSVLLTAHATEILFKARIAQEHPLLIFEKFPKATDEKISLKNLFDDGHTIEWNALPNMLWATVDCSLPKRVKDKFKAFGNLRNSIQHFGASPNNKIAYLEAIKFIYEVVDPLINDWWGLYAIDYSQDYNEELEPDENPSYWEFIKNYIIQYEIDFKVSPRLANNTDLWWDATKKDTKKSYQSKIQNQINKMIL